ncbi:MAG: class I SAM-dependent methyltransferase [Desulfocapsa sp.]|nr:class I SAM-dependent methyltransferase [Desulfocapsa sp.]
MTTTPLLGRYFRKLKAAIPRRRELLARRYLRGCGLEIGALHRPLPLPSAVRVQYVDIASREENIQKFPELDPSDIVEVDYIDDGFILSEIPENTQDFLIANHVLEHSPNPIQVLKNWCRPLKPNGLLFVTIPIAEKCFDKGRPETTLDHLIDDYNLYNRPTDHLAQQRIKEKNRDHLREWITLSERRIFSKRDSTYIKPSVEEIEKRIEHTDTQNSEIHFHTFSMDSYSRLLDYFTKTVETGMEIEKVCKSRKEIVSILVKSST